MPEPAAVFSCLLRHHPVQAGRERVDVDNRQAAGVGVGGDFLLQDGAKRLPEHQGQHGQQHDQRQALETLAAVFCADESVQGCQRGQPAGDGVIRPAAGVDRQPGLAILQARQSLADGFAHLPGRDFADQEEPGRVRVSAHRDGRVARRQDVQGGVLEGMVAAGRVDVGGLQDVDVCHFLPYFWSQKSLRSTLWA